MVAIAAVTVLLAGTGAVSGTGQGKRPPTATLATFAGRWTGHTRVLKVHRDGRATESIYSGCCSPQLNLTLLLSHPRGTPADASVHARVTGVWIRDKAAFTRQHPGPQVGDIGTLRLRRAVIYDPFTHTDYCSSGGTRSGA